MTTDPLNSRLYNPMNVPWKENYRWKEYINIMKLMEDIAKWQVGEWWNMHTQQVGPDTMKETRLGRKNILS